MEGNGEAAVQISVLGPPSVVRDGRPVEFDTRKATALLAFLAVTGRRPRRDTLAALLWPDADEAHARAALRRTLSVIRQVLGPDALEVTRYDVDLRDPAASDIALFAAHLDRVAAHDHRDEPVCAGCIDELEAAARLYRGGLLEGFTLRDSPPFDDWQAVEGERVRRSLAGALARLVDGCRRLGHADRAIAHAEQWLGLDPLHEAAHRALMTLHAERGDRAAAVRQYRQCVRALDEDLGVAPLDETSALYAAIATDATPATTVGAPIAAPMAWGRYPLVGRRAEVAALRDGIAAGNLIVVEGEPGVGKTRLVEEVLDALRRDGLPVLAARCYEGEIEVPYAPIVELVRTAIAREGISPWLAELPAACSGEAARLVPELVAVGGAEPPPPGGPGAEVRFLDGVTRTLAAAAGTEPPGVLFLDDVHWADTATQQFLAFALRRLAGGGPAVILARRTGEVGDAGPLMRAVGECRRENRAVTVHVPRLDVAAIAELVEAAPIDREVVDTDALVDEIHRETEGVAFLVVAYLDAAAGGDPPARSGTFADLVQSRLAGLSGVAGQVLTAASVIGRSFTFDAVRETSGRSDDETVSALDELVGRGFVDERGSPDGATYDFSHGKVRQFVYDDTTLARRRLLHRRVAQALVASARGSDPASAAASIAGHQHLGGRDGEAALAYAQAGDHARAVYANADALAHYQAALGLGHPDGAMLHEAVGDLETLAGRFADAVVSYERAAATCAAVEMSRLEGKLGDIRQRLGEWPTAEQHYDAALTALGPDGDRPRRARLLANWALTVHRRGEPTRAQALGDEALETAERSGDDAAASHAATVAGILAHHRGDVDAARRLLRSSLATALAVGDPLGQVAAANGLARVERAAGDVAASEALLVGALQLCAEIGDRQREAALHDHLADILHAEGRHDEAMVHLKQAVTIFADIGADEGTVQPEIWKLTEWAG